jgi:hypothetical protein
MVYASMVKGFVYVHGIRTWYTSWYTYMVSYMGVMPVRREEKEGGDE